MTQKSRALSTNLLRVKQYIMLFPVPGNYAPLMCMLGLSSVIGKEIISVYPENEGLETKYSWIGSGTIKPRSAHTKFDTKQKIIIMWSKAGSSSFLSGVDEDFKPNHFVPLVDIESCHPHTGFSRTARKMSSTRIEVDGKKDHPQGVHDLESDRGMPLRTVKGFQLQTSQNVMKCMLLASLSCSS